MRIRRSNRPQLGMRFVHPRQMKEVDDVEVARLKVERVGQNDINAKPMELVVGPKNLRGISAVVGPQVGSYAEQIARALFIVRIDGEPDCGVDLGQPCMSNWPYASSPVLPSPMQPDRKTLLADMVGNLGRVALQGGPCPPTG